MKKYQVFVSSTYYDLCEERQEIIKTILNSNCIPVGMEFFPASGKDPLEVIKKIIDYSDYYLLVIGGRYGSLTKQGISYTEEEYNYAKSRGIEIIPFIHSNREALPSNKTEATVKNKKKLEVFIKKVEQNNTPAWWQNKGDLQVAVATSLKQAIENSPAQGWIRTPKCLSINDSKFNDRYIEKEKVKLVHWKKLSANEQQQYYRSFIDLKPKHHKPRYHVIGINKQEERNSRHPIDLVPLNGLLAAFQIKNDNIKLPISNEEYENIHEKDIEYSEIIYKEIKKGLNDTQKKAVNAVYDYLSCPEYVATTLFQRKCDVVIVPGGRIAHSYRADEAYKIAVQSECCSIILSGLHPYYDIEQGLPIGEAEAMYYYLERIKHLDTKHVELFIENRARNTKETALHIIPHLQDLYLKRKRKLNIIITTSPYHVRRFLLMISSMLLPEYDEIINEIQCVVATTSYDRRIFFDTSYYNEEQRLFAINTYVREYFKLIGGRATGEF